MDDKPIDKMTESELQLLLLLASSESYPLEDFVKLVDSIKKEVDRRPQKPLF